MKVLHVVGGLDFGGIEKWLSNVFAESKDDIDSYIMSMDPTKKSILPYLNINLEKVFFAKKKDYFSRLYSLMKFILSKKPDVVHCHAGYSSGLYALIAKLCRVKIVAVHSHSDRRLIDKHAGILKKVYIFIMKSLIRTLNVKRLAVSDGSAQSLFYSDYSVIYCGVPINKVDIDVDSLDLLDKKTKKIFHIGRYTEAKNFPFILDLMEELKNDKSFHFVFISGELDEFKDLCNNKEIDNVTFLGQVNDPSSVLHKYADIFILPSKWEGLPLSAVEAQLVGVKCVLSSSISREVDLGMATFLDLVTSEWIQELNKSCHDVRVIDDVKASRFAIKSNVDKLKLIYSGFSDK
ncbi:glycosyltransferase [Aeromonas veronii]